MAPVSWEPMIYTGFIDYGSFYNNNNNSIEKRMMGAWKKSLWSSPHPSSVESSTGGPERLVDLPKVTQHVSGRETPRAQAPDSQPRATKLCRIAVVDISTKKCISKPRPPPAGNPSYQFIMV